MKNENPYIDTIASLLGDNRIMDALKYVREHDKKHVCADLLSDCGMTYRYMLSYFENSTRSASDPSRHDIIVNTREELWRAADMLHIADIKSTAEGQFFSAMRSAGINEENTIINNIAKIKSLASRMDIAREAGVKSEDLNRSVERASEKLFNSVWTTVFLPKAEQTALLEFLTAPESAALSNTKALVLSALLLTSLKYYDYRKLEVLLKSAFANTGESMLTARALVGALLVIAAWPERVRNNKKITALAIAVSDDEHLRKALRSFVPAMLRTIDTERVNRRVKDEIIPELMRMKPDIEKSLRRMGGKADIYEIEENPDWEDLLNKSGVTDKLKELTRMQMDGADIFMSAFSQMKGFPFFRPVSNWLLPFDMDIAALEQAREKVPASVLKMLTKGHYFCASDKYSMVLALEKMPPAQFEMMNSQLSTQMDAMNEEAATTLLGNSMSLYDEIGLYLKDLYRFYRLKNDDDTDPFRDIFSIPQIEPFIAMHGDIELQRNIAEFYFRYGYWQQAYDAFAVVASLGAPEEDVLQKQGYCLQLLGRDEEALAVYQQAELINPNSGWLLKRIATLLRDMRQYEEATDYARRALELKKDSLSLEMLLGTTLMLAGNADEALKIFFKIKYLKPNNTKVLRPIAWCEFLRGNYDKSVNRYDSLPDITSDDMLNCGHALFAKGDIKEAMTRYRTCLRTLKGGNDTFRTLMHQDTEYLRAAGISTEEMSLMTELVTSNLE
ncbi:MAG: hypothetical protein NC217_01735 [Muribaculaceae bacterium]|nr:hypothetical protein [Muribaculaceae bacterium]